MSVVLVVDDEADMRLLARLVLVSAGHSVIEADCCAAALATFDGQPAPEVVLLDMRMPGADGWEVRRRARADGRHARVPVIVFTAAPVGCGTTAGDGDGDDDQVLAKPYRPDDLLAAVERALGTSRGTPQAGVNSP
ncbi:MAG: response regulator [Acidimicrobiia bacterium]